MQASSKYMTGLPFGTSTFVIVITLHRGISSPPPPSTIALNRATTHCLHSATCIQPENYWINLNNIKTNPGTGAKLTQIKKRKHCKNRITVLDLYFYKIIVRKPNYKLQIDCIRLPNKQQSLVPLNTNYVFRNRIKKTKQKCPFLD